MSNRTLNDTAASVLGALMDLHNITDGAMGSACGKDRNWVQARRTRTTKISLTDLELLAEALDLPPTTFFMEPAEALRFSLDHPSDQGIRRIIWEIGAYHASSSGQLAFRVAA